MRKLIVFSFITFLFTLHAFAQAPFELQLNIDKDKVLIGDEIEFSVDILHGTDMQLLDLPTNLDLSPFEIKSMRRLEPKIGNQAVGEGFRLILTVFQTGELKIPAFPIQLKKKDGKIISVTTDEWPVSVQTLIANVPEDADIRPIKGQKDLDPDHIKKLWTGAILSVLGVLLAALFIYWAVRRYLAWLESKRPPIEKAVRELDVINKAQYLQSGNVKELYAQVSRTVKLYLMREFKLGTLDLTTKEYTELLARSDDLTPVFNPVDELFIKSDMVKYAKFSVTKEEAEGLIASVKSLLLQAQDLADAKKKTSKKGEVNASG